jgi:hypothetical protein
MKSIIFFLLSLFLLTYCASPNSRPLSQQKESSITGDTIKIANEELEYEVIIIDAGFNSWFLTQARPRNFYSQSYLESRNRAWVMEYNLRTMQPQRFSPNLYLMSIDYQSNIDYGYEVNYMLFNYLVYFQQVNNQPLGMFMARP